MAIEYRFLDRTDETLIATSELPVEEGIAVAVRTTGYEVGADEIVELAIVDFQGTELFSKVVKPQNIEEWSDAVASGGIMPADVAEAPELFQFEDEISELFEKASIVVGQHTEFIHEMIEASWVTLPSCKEYDLISEFCASHSNVDYPGQPAAVAALADIAAYYKLDCDESGPVAIARTVAACYIAMIREHASERLAKGPEHWQRYEQRLEEERKNDMVEQAKERQAQVKTLRTNAILWLCAAAIFSNLAVQLHIRAFESSIVIIAAAAAIFTAVKWIQCLVKLFKLRNPK